MIALWSSPLLLPLFSLFPRSPLVHDVGAMVFPVGTDPVGYTPVGVTPAGKYYIDTDPVGSFSYLSVGLLI